MKLLERVITIPSRAGEFRLIPIGCLHADSDGHRKQLWEECKKEILKPNTYMIGAGDYRDLLRTTAMRYLKGYTSDSTSMKTLDDMVRESTIDFYHDYFKGLEAKIIGLCRGNHLYEYQNGTNDNQQLCQLLNVPYLDNPSFIRLRVQTPDGKTINTLRILLHHGHWGGGSSRVGGDVNSAEMKAAGFDFDIYVFSHCFDDETEVLTQTGWKKHYDIEEGTPILTYNRERDVTEWDPILEVVRHSTFKELHYLKTKYINLAVTDDHGLWGQPLAGGDWKELSVADASRHWMKFRSTAQHAQEDIKLSDSWIRLLAWMMTEGTTYAINGKLASASIAQSDLPDGRLQKLKDTIVDCGLEFSLESVGYPGDLRVIHGKEYKLNWPAYRLRLKKGKTYRLLFATYLELDKSPKPALTNMSPRQIRVFLEAYADGDGHIRSRDGFQLATKRQDWADWLQSLAVRAGYRTSLIVNKKSGMWYLTCHTQVITTAGPKHWTKSPYGGIAWCVRVKNGTVVVRRKGKVCVTLNTHRKWAMHIPTLTIPRTGELEVVERPRCFIRTGCFVAGYDKKCGDGNYVQDKLMHPSDLGYVTLTVKFYREYDADNYQRRRALNPTKPPREMRGAGTGRDRYKFSVTF